MTPPDAQTVDQAVRVIDLTGVLANAVLGGIAARTARLDIVGFIVLAILSGLGGGMIRDALLQAGPVAAVADPLYLVMALIGAGVAFVIPFRSRPARWSLTLLDALSLGCWANVGAQKTLELGLSWLPAVLMGALTAVGGSTVRDVMLQKTPSIFGGRTLSATSALVASSITVVLWLLGHSTADSIAAIVVAATFSLLARHFDWELPHEVHAPRPARQASRWLSHWWGVGTDAVHHLHHDGGATAVVSRDPDDRNDRDDAATREEVVQREQDRNHREHDRHDQ
ncbi:trimeric intracellular cation channel family protein [Tersicoccus sp. Bi-70]|uniref:trimeric intracellular cation channel family protein n=1 Tax=Tersicoccus sp. Bi-70 TaxID=1897634 RepID=UPI0009F91B66|nr:trimeric intracellular cation channel family protein [Tersicoccus sp. Bi-70]